MLMGEGAINIPQLSSLYIKFANEEVAQRHPGELVLRDGLIYLDYDAQGFLCGIEIADCDPQTGTGTIDYMQPVNPLVN